MKKTKCCLIIATTLLISGITNSFAVANSLEKNINVIEKDHDVTLQKLETYIKGKDTSDRIALDYIKSAVGENYLSKIASEYASSFPKEL